VVPFEVEACKDRFDGPYGMVNLVVDSLAYVEIAVFEAVVCISHDDEIPRNGLVGLSWVPSPAAKDTSASRAEIARRGGDRPVGDITEPSDVELDVGQACGRACVRWTKRFILPR
jgi:hypothetical protein